MRCHPLLLLLFSRSTTAVHFSSASAASGTANSATPLDGDPSIAIRAALTSCCTNTCQHANDGLCDDGGIGAMYSSCAFASDVSHAAARTLY